MRKLLLAIVFILGIYFFITQFPQLQEAVGTLERGVIWFILGAILLEVVWYVNIGASYRSIYHILGMDEKLLQLTLLSLAAYSANIIAPSAGVSGVAVFIANNSTKNHSNAKITIAGALFVLFDYVGFLVVLVLGLAVLARRNQLGWPEITASIILVIIALSLTAILYLGARSAESLGRVLAWLANIVNKVARPFIKRDYLSIARSYAFAEEASEGIHALRMDPRNWVKPFALALTNKALLITILCFIFLAFNVPFSAGTLIAGFSIGYLFLIVSPTPSGIGVVEGMLTLSLTTLFVPIEASTIIVLAYRGITFWLPFLAGFIAFRFLAKQRTQEAA
jgi:uncharacterized protein (TIRG00374 family)